MSDDKGYLIVTRRIGQRILVGDDIVIQVTKISHTDVRLGIEAPKGISIDREEVRRRKEQQKEEA